MFKITLFKHTNFFYFCVAAFTYVYFHQILQMNESQNIRKNGETYSIYHDCHNGTDWTYSAVKILTEWQAVHTTVPFRL